MKWVEGGCTLINLGIYRVNVNLDYKLVDNCFVL